MEEWLSDAALAKSAALRDWPEESGPPPIEMFCGIWEPRVQPTEEERCVCCGLDAREEVGGEEHHDQRWCSICVGRGHEEDGPRHASPVADQPDRTDRLP